MDRTTILMATTGALLLGAVGSLGACSSSSGGTGGGGTTYSSTSSSGAAATPDCQTYCTTIMKNCTGGDGSTGAGGNAMPDPTKTTQQYTGMDQCLSSCKAFPVGTAADVSGNTLGCRQYHAGAAASDAATHCPHAGPGGDGVCGAKCDGYCQIAMKYCTAANMAATYTDLADCQATCAATKDDVRFNIGVQDGDHVSCLLYHVQEGSVVPPDHCIGDLAKQMGVVGGSVTCH